MLKKLTFTAALSMAFASSAFAQDVDTDGFTGEASLTGGKTTGNTDTQDLSLGLKLANEDGKWRHKVDALVDYGKAGGSKTKQRYALGYQIDRDISERAYVYGNADYFNDKFGAYEDGYFLGAGLGYKFILPDPVGWNLEAGLGYRAQNPIIGSQTNEVAFRGASDFDYALNDNVSLYNDTEILLGSNDTYVWNEVGLSAQLMGSLAARISYRVDHHSTVPSGFKKTDTAARFGVVYTIK